MKEIDAMIRLRESLAKRLVKPQEVAAAEYPVREMAEQLMQLTDQQFGRYAFYHEPLAGRISASEQER